MRRAAFFQFLTTTFRKAGSSDPLPDSSANSYCAYVSGAEELLGADIDTAILKYASASSLESAIRASRARAPKTISNYVSGVRAYLEFARSS